MSWNNLNRTRTGKTSREACSGVVGTLAARSRWASAVATAGRSIVPSSGTATHCGGSALPCIAAQTRAGFSGMSMCATP